MKANSVITSLLCATAAFGLAIWLAVGYQARLRLGDEHKALEQQLDQMAGLVAENERLAKLVAQASRSQSLTDDRSRELLRLRGEAGVLRRQTKELETLREENRQARAALDSSRKTQNGGAAGAAATADYWPRDSWTFVGYGSPDASLQTSIWAANKGDVKALLAGMTGELQQMVQKDLSGKSDSEAAAKAADEVANLKSVRVLNRDVQADDTVVLTAVFEEGDRTETNGLVLKRVGNDWKLSGHSQ